MVTALLAEQLPATDGRILVAVAIIGVIGAPLTAWIQVRGARREASEAKDAARAAAESVGPVNGHGTVQDATSTLIAESRQLGVEIREELRATRATVELLVQSVSTVNDRLKAHDRELAEQRHRIDAWEEQR